MVVGTEQVVEYRISFGGGMTGRRPRSWVSCSARRRLCANSSDGASGGDVECSVLTPELPTRGSRRTVKSGPVMHVGDPMRWAGVSDEHAAMPITASHCLPASACSGFAPLRSTAGRMRHQAGAQLIDLLVHDEPPERRRATSFPRSPSMWLMMTGWLRGLSGVCAARAGAAARRRRRPGAEAARPRRSWGCAP